MKLTDKIFKNKKFNTQRLQDYGFKYNNDAYIFVAPIMNGEFTLCISIDKLSEISLSVTETDTNEPYTLFGVEDATGAFIGEIRSVITQILADISDKCCKNEIYKQKQTHEIIKYAKIKYGDIPEFLWNDDNSILRRKDTGKWYATFLKTDKNKLQKNLSGKCEIVNFRVPVEKVETLINTGKFFPAFHMNKKHWISVILDGTTANEVLFELLDKSYSLAKK